jgi:hypothetical protein
MYLADMESKGMRQRHCQRFQADTFHISRHPLKIDPLDSLPELQKAWTCEYEPKLLLASRYRYSMQLGVP